MKLKKNLLKIILGVCLIIGILSGKTLATSKSSNTLTEEKVQTMVQEQGRDSCPSVSECLP